MLKEVAMEKARVRTFRDLIAWQKGIDLAVLVYRDTAAMPRDERFGLTMQMRRSAVSVPSNIAEGHGRQSRSDYLRFLRVARGSLSELATQIELAESLDMLPVNGPRRDLTQETDRVLQGLIRAPRSQGKLAMPFFPSSLRRFVASSLSRAHGYGDA
jgi:four helix bundle protein